MPRHELSAKDVPLSNGARPQDIPFYLLGVIRLDAEGDQSLANALVLIGVLRTQRFGERVPKLLENDYQLLGSNVLLACLVSDFLQKVS